MAAVVLDQLRNGLAQPEFDAVPAFQWSIYFDDLAPACPSRLNAAPVRQRNALRIELLPETARCSRRSPDGRGLVWLLSGGDALSYGRCEQGSCPRCVTETDHAAE